jgi:16S rRNA (cytidine1402-2'-O)-methyltransferase
LASRDRIRGEITLLVAPPAPGSSDAPIAAAGQKVAVRIAQIQVEAGVDEKEALKRLARELGQSKSDVYRELQRERARLSAGSRRTRITP